MTASALIRTQFWALAGLSVLLLWLAPDVWNYSPDSGIYVGTAASLAESGSYWFNGYPNLLYYPGLPGLLSLTILVFGLNFHAMHLLCAGIVVACLWLARSYFSHERYGIAGLLVPVLMAASGIFLRQNFSILSDGLFLALVLAALLFWRRYAETAERRVLVACCVVVATVPLVRFPGLLLCAALGLALLHHDLARARPAPGAMLRAALIGGTTVLPFALWTWRNWALHTPDTFNMANDFFFGLGGLALYAPGFGAVDWIQADWQYPFFRLLLFVSTLGETVLGSDIVQVLPVWLRVLLIAVLAAAGAARWFRRGTSMERAYVVLSLLFLLVWTLKGGRSLYIVPRYWLPVLPFVLLLAGLGLAALHERLGRSSARHAVVAGSGALALLTAINGAAVGAEFAAKRDYYRNAHRAIQATAEFVAGNVPAGALIATTDWGVMPFLLQRQSYQVLNDPSHRLSLERMQKYRTRYLVILDDLAAFPPTARAMVGRLPELFDLVFERRADDSGPSVSVYAVRLDGVGRALERIARVNRDAGRKRPAQ